MLTVVFDEPMAAQTASLTGALRAPAAGQPLPLPRAFAAQAPAIPVAPLPRFLVFDPSPDHDSSVDGYLVDVVLPSTVLDTLVRVDIGKPAVVGGECQVELGAILEQLGPGTYVVVVRALNAAGASEGAMSAPFTI